MGLADAFSYAELKNAETGIRAEVIGTVEQKHPVDSILCNIFPDRAGIVPKIDQMDLRKGVRHKRHERIGIGIAQNEQGRGVFGPGIHNGAGNVAAEEKSVFVLDREFVVIVERKRLLCSVCFIPGNRGALRRRNQCFHFVRSDPEKSGGGIERPAEAVGDCFRRECCLIDLRQPPRTAQGIGGIIGAERRPMVIGAVENVFTGMRRQRRKKIYSI